MRSWIMMVTAGARLVVAASHEETDSPTYADDRNFYKVEKRARDCGKRGNSI
jgi:hypothetical protein